MVVRGRQASAWLLLLSPVLSSAAGETDALP
jgi:hypothetical protein